MTFKCTTAVRKTTDFIVVHCSATTAKMSKVDAAEIDRWHRAKGWQCIGYHFVIKRDGTVEEGREQDKIGAHVEGYNSNSVGICLVGGLADDGKTAENNFTPEQLASLKKLLKAAKVKHPKAVIQGHRDFPGVKKDCPSFDVKTWIKEQGV